MDYVLPNLFQINHYYVYQKIYSAFFHFSNRFLNTIYLFKHIHTQINIVKTVPNKIFTLTQ